MTAPRIAVVGGGISGLVAARSIMEKEWPERPVLALFEAEGRLGGTVATEMRDDFLLEGGPDSFLTEKPAMLDLVRHLKLEGELIPTNPACRRSFVVRDGKLHPSPDGFYLIAPVKEDEFLASGLFSEAGKARMLAETSVPPRMDDTEESVASFVRRRFGDEALDRVGQPMIGGIYTGDPEYLSIDACFPRFRELEKRHGSVLKGLRAEEVRGADQASGPRYSLFVSLRGGMSSVVMKLFVRLPMGVPRLKCPVTALARTDTGKWRLSLGTGEPFEADAVCLALPVAKTAALLENTSPAVTAKLRAIRHESVATVNFAYERGDVAHALDGFGFVVPRTERASITACSFSSVKFEGRAPEGKILLRAFVGGVFGKEAFARADTELIAAAEADLARYLGITGKPLFSTLRRYPDAMVQYGLGHPALISGIRREMEALPGVRLTGPAFRGNGLPDCVADAEAQAASIHSFLMKSFPAQ
jgi:oxygen-dependent protoporphyrinogen oxidase